MNDFKLLHLYQDFYYKQEATLVLTQNGFKEALLEFLATNSLVAREFVLVQNGENQAVNQSEIKNQNWELYKKFSSDAEFDSNKKEAKNFYLHAGDYLFLQEAANQNFSYEEILKTAMEAAPWLSVEIQARPILRIVSEDNRFSFQWLIAAKSVERLF